MDVCHCTVAYNFYSVSVASRVFWWLHCNSSQTYETGKITLFIGKKTKFYIGKRYGYVTDMEQKYTPKDKHCVLNIQVL